MSGFYFKGCVFWCCIAVCLSSCPGPYPQWIPFGSSCYMISPTLMNWYDAQKFCQTNRGYLVEVGSQEEQEFIDLLMSSHTATGAYWLGLSDMRLEGTWQWQNSFVEASYVNWFPENPHNDIQSNCAEILIDGDIDGRNWYDIHCERDRDPTTSWAIHAICETQFMAQ